MNVPSNIGRYSIVKAIGHGGMGSLYLAWDAKLERQIAIKVLKEDDQDLRERFAREAKSAARLRHPHIVTIFELGEHEGQPYIAMEYIHGRTLAQIIREREDVPLGRTLELMADLCDGLAFAHKAGIIHRDVKPANIMVDEEGTLKILDFGIARLAESAGMTQAGMMIGTLNYMSPEQVTGQPADRRSDIFAVGLVFYELLAQKEAFAGTVSTGILYKILHTEPVPLTQACPGLDEDVIRIVGRAIEKDVNRRYQDLTEMRREILRAGRHIETGDGLTRVRETPAPHVPPLTSPSEPPVSERIHHYLDEADRAIKEERYDSAIEACEHLLMLDAENARAMDLAARARKAIDARRAERLLSQAERDLQAGSLTLAAERIDQAGLLRPSDEQKELREEVERARVARETKPTEGPAPPLAQPRPSSRGAVIPIAAVIVILLAGGAYYWVASPRPPAPTPTPQAVTPAPHLPPPDPATTPAAQDGLAEVERRQAALAASEREQALATAKAAETKRLEVARTASIALFSEGQKLEQQRQYDRADEKYREAFGADKNNEKAADAFARGERYRKAKAAGLAAVKANDREAALRAFGDARSINSARFLADGLDKAIGDNTRGRAAPPPAPAPSAPAPTPSAPPPAPTADQSAIATVLGALAKALSTETNKSRDLNMVRQIWPSAGGDVFGNRESQTYRFSDLVFLSPPGDKVSVDCYRVSVLAVGSTGKTTVARDPVRIELQKAKGTWRVMSIVERSR